jgi:hypothetical protein
VSAEKRLRPPQGGTPPPAFVAQPDGSELELRPLAKEICRRYREEFPDEERRYGDAGVAWCVHDNLHILNWAFLDGDGLLERQVAWLAGVLDARGFPLERLARDLELAADVVRDAHPQVAESLARATGSVRPPL